jgi:hypothetical protein
MSQQRVAATTLHTTAWKQSLPGSLDRDRKVGGIVGKTTRNEKTSLGVCAAFVRHAAWNGNANKKPKVSGISQRPSVDKSQLVGGSSGRLRTRVIVVVV